jgi:hypothetical protein
MTCVVSERAQNGQDTRKMGIKVFTNFWRESSDQRFEEIPELVEFLKQSALGKDVGERSAIGRICVDSFKQQHKRVFGRNSEHDRRGQQATRAKGLHCFLQIHERSSVNVWHLAAYGIFVGSHVMEEVRVASGGRTLSTLRQPEEGELSVVVIHSESDDPLAEQIPEQFQQCLLVLCVKGIGYAEVAWLNPCLPAREDFSKAETEMLVLAGFVRHTFSASQYVERCGA